MEKQKFQKLMGLAEFVLCVCAVKIGFTYSDDCDTNMTISTITMKKWLIVRGIVGLSVLPISIFACLCIIGQCKYNFPLGIVMITLIFITFFHIAWHIVGFVVLFYSNIECFNIREPMAVYMACDLIITGGLSLLYSFIFSAKGDNDILYTTTRASSSNV